MICPSCSEDIDPVGVDIAPPLAICPSCERSLVQTDGALRLATSGDVERLADPDRRALSLLRVQTRKARRAYFELHHAH